MSSLLCLLHRLTTANQSHIDRQSSKTFSDRTTVHPSVVKKSAPSVQLAGGLADTGECEIRISERTLSSSLDKSLAADISAPLSRTIRDTELDMALTEESKSEIQDDATSRLRRMLNAVETKLGIGGSRSLLAPEYAPPRYRLVDEHGNCLLGCEGRCKCLSYAEPPIDDGDKLMEDMYLMSGGLEPDENAAGSDTTELALNPSSEAPDQADGRPCIRDKATYPAKDLTDSQSELTLVQELMDIKIGVSKQRPAPVISKQLSAMSLAYRAMFDGSKWSSKNSEVQTPASETTETTSSPEAPGSSLTSVWDGEEYYRLLKGLESDDASLLGRM